jgi:hypothetical protein
MMSNQMTAEEYMRVELATKHESYSHRYWPQEVVRAIAGAEINPAAQPPRRSAPAGLSRRLKGVRSRLRLARLRRRRREAGGTEDRAGS